MIVKVVIGTICVITVISLQDVVSIWVKKDIYFAMSVLANIQNALCHNFVHCVMAENVTIMVVTKCTLVSPVVAPIYVSTVLLPVVSVFDFPPFEKINGRKSRM